MNRRRWIRTAGGAAAGAAWPLMAAPTAPVAVARCRSYDPAELLPVMERMFDQLGGLGRLMKGKTVAMKVNLTGFASVRLGHLPAERAHWTHPQVIAAATHLFGKAGARRVRILEGCYASGEPLEEFMLSAGWEPRLFLGAAPRVELENTNVAGGARRYSRVNVPGGGRIYPGFDLNHSFTDCDVFVSLAKLKEHATAGITLSMKNCFGNPPCTIYGRGAGEDEPSLVPYGGRDMFHDGRRQPSRSAPQENAHGLPRDGGVRVPRIVVDIVAARPIGLAIVEGIETMSRGEGPWIQGCRPVAPGVIAAGTNCVTTDAVCAALMGFDPLATRGTAPFERCDSTLELGEQAGLGTRDLKRIEVLGTPVREARFDFRRAGAAARKGA